MDRSEIEAAIRWLTRLHGGPFSRGEALAAGLSDDALQRRRADRSLVTLHHGVYVPGTMEADATDRAVAAALACGEGAVIARRSAALVHRLLDHPPDVAEVIVPRDRRVVLSGITVWRAGPIPSRDRGEFRGVQVTTPVRTLVDLASVLEPVALQATIDRALTSGRVRSASLRKAADAASGRRGIRVLRQILSEREGPTYRSGAERTLVELLVGAGFARPETQHVVRVGRRRYELDVAWPQERIGVEFDSEQWHGDARRAAASAARRAALAEAGWRVFVVDDVALASGLGDLIRQLRALLPRAR